MHIFLAVLHSLHICSQASCKVNEAFINEIKYNNKKQKKKTFSSTNTNTAKVALNVCCVHTGA